MNELGILTKRQAQSAHAANLMRGVVLDTSDATKVYLSAMVSPAQKTLIEALAKINRTRQADVLRAIIDEWCELKLSGVEPEAT